MATVKREGDTIFIQSGDRMRRVGIIIPASKPTDSTIVVPTEAGESILFVERDKEKHLMQVWDAYGFSKEVMDQEGWFDYVQLEEKDGGTRNTYLIPRHILTIYGREHQTESFERQYFVPLSKLKPYLI